MTGLREIGDIRNSSGLLTWSARRSDGIMESPAGSAVALRAGRPRLALAPRMRPIMIPPFATGRRQKPISPRLAGGYRCRFTRQAAGYMGWARRLERDGYFATCHVICHAICHLDTFDTRRVKASCSRLNMEPGTEIGPTG